jgi:hypothetical protein
MHEAMAKVMAAARARRERRATAPVTARGRLKAALSPARWRAGAGRWLPARVETGGMVVVQEHVPAKLAAADAALVAEALVQLAPAASRAALYGTEVTVRLDDQRLAEVFRAALEQTAKERPTNRLVKIVVAGA